MKFLCLKTAFKMTIRISHDCIMSVSCLKMQTFVSIQLTCRASETYYKLEIDFSSRLLRAFVSCTELVLFHMGDKLEIDKTNPMLLTGWYFNVN